MGAAAAGAAILYWATHKSTTVVGCVVSGTDGNTIQNEKDHKTYALVAGGDPLHPGDRMELGGKKSKDKSGHQGLQIQKVVRNFGSCNGEHAMNQMSSSEHQ